MPIYFNNGARYFRKGESAIFKQDKNSEGEPCHVIGSFDDGTKANVLTGWIITFDNDDPKVPFHAAVDQVLPSLK